jgi:hypothetical protein
LGFSNDIAGDMSADAASSLAGDGYDPLAALKTYQRLLPTILGIWHCRYGIAPAAGPVGSWTDQQTGVVCAANTGEELPYSVSSNFVGQKTPRTGRTPVSMRVATASALGTALLPTSTNAYLVSVFARTSPRLTDAGGEEQTLVAYCRGSDQIPGLEFRDRSNNSTAVSFMLRNNGSWAADLPVADTAPHIAEGWYLPDQTMNARLDGGSIVTVSASGSGNTGTDITRVAIGNLGPYVRRGNYEHALHILASAYPGDSAAQALRDFIHSDFVF